MSTNEISFTNTSGYQQVDTAELDRQQWLFQFLDSQSSSKSNQEMKAIVIDHMNLNSGDSVIDIGCGLGDEVRTLAELVGPNGHAAGWDLSNLFLTEAERRSEGIDLPVSWHQGDAHNLSFEDKTFDAARAERTFMWLEDPKRALTELTRVVRTDGRIAFIEPDHGTRVQVTRMPDLLAKLYAYWDTENPEGGRIGSRLPVLFAECGLTNIDVIPHLLVVDSTQAKRGSEITGRDAPPWYAEARDQGFLTAEEHDELLADYVHLRETGLHYLVITHFIVAGTVTD